jgi:hypothetical protein
MKNGVFSAVVVLALTLVLISCDSPGYEIEEIEEGTPDSVTTANNTEIKKEIELPKPEIKEEISSKEINVSKKYVIQIGAFNSQKHAEEFTLQAKEKTEFEFYYKLIEGLFKVRYGDFSLNTDVTSVLTKIKEAGYTDAFVIVSAK